MKSIERFVMNDNKESLVKEVMSNYPTVVENGL